MTELRPYQSSSVDALRRSVAAGHRRPLLQAPTGSGKTVVAASIMASAVERGNRVLFLAPRRELVDQCAAKLRAAGVDHGILMAGRNGDPTGRVQVASAPTLYARCIRTHRAPLPPAGLIVVDEAHLAITPSVRRILEAYPRASVVGLTATPARGDGRGLGEVFDDLVLGPSVAELVEQGFLVPQRYFAPSKPDLAGVRIERGDYVQDDLEDRMDRPTLVGDVVSNWLRLAQYRQTVVFATSIKHSIHLRDRFREVGITAEHLDANTPNEEREAVLQRVASGETQVVCNCFLLSYGWDCPPISCAVLARPTKSVVLYLQMVGRILRPHEGKDDALIIDHAAAVDEIGFVDEPMPWSLDGRERVQERRQTERKRSKPLTCEQCFAIYAGQLACPHCG
ncbi:MAG: DEAD/DEAH box helicase, partial [Deltaproteobacteria bacterium]|nr:DEAD/DEAH box helicase [Deltaproteobacteria bacterium]